MQVLAWFCAGASTASAILMWLNLRGFRVTLDDDAAQRMTLGASAMTACAVAFLLLAIVRYSVGRRVAPAGGLAVATVVVLSLALPLAARGFGQPAPPPVRRSVDGHPHCRPARRLAGVAGRHRRRVARYHLAGGGGRPAAQASGGCSTEGHRCTSRRCGPTQPAPVWTAVATGKLPAKNGVRSAAMYGAAPAAPRSICCLTSASRTRWCRRAVCRDDADLGRRARSSRSGRFSAGPASRRT